MFKRIAGKLRPGNQSIDKIRIEYGGLLDQTDCQSILFFLRPKFDWGGSLNHAVLTKAGPELDQYVLSHVTTPKSGEVFALPPFKTNYKAIFAAILADWDGGNGFEERDLLNCYRGAVSQAQEKGIKSIGIPALGRDKRDFPHVRFTRLALQAIVETMDDRLDFVKIMCVDRNMMAAYQGQLEKMRRKAD